MFATPAENAETIPEAEPTDAVDADELDHVPPTDEFVSVSVLPTQSVVSNPGKMFPGSAFTVRKDVT